MYYITLKEEHGDLMLRIRDSVGEIVGHECSTKEKGVEIIGTFLEFAKALDVEVRVSINV
jgi:hypothetical protein